MTMTPWSHTLIARQWSCTTQKSIHAGYTANLNAAIQGTEHEGKSIEEIMIEGMDKPAIRSNGGGYWNHSLFWKIMSPSGGGEPQGMLANAINDHFGSFLRNEGSSKERCND